MELSTSELPSPAELEGASSWIVQVTSASDAASVLPLVASLARDSASLKNLVVMVGTAAVGMHDNTSTMAAVEAGWEAVVEASKGGNAFRCTMLVVDGIYDGSNGGWGDYHVDPLSATTPLTATPPPLPGGYPPSSLIASSHTPWPLTARPARPLPHSSTRPTRWSRSRCPSMRESETALPPSPPSCRHRHCCRHGHRDDLKPCPLPPTIRPLPRLLQPLSPCPRLLQLLPPCPRPLQPLHTRATDTDAAAAAAVFTVVSPPRGGSICLQR